MAREMTKSRATGFKDCYTTVLLPSYVNIKHSGPLKSAKTHRFAGNLASLAGFSHVCIQGGGKKKVTFVPCRLLTSRFIFGFCPSIQSTPIRPDMMKPTRNLQPARGVTQQTGSGSGPPHPWQTIQTNTIPPCKKPTSLRVRKMIGKCNLSCGLTSSIHQHLPSAILRGGSKSHATLRCATARCSTGGHALAAAKARAALAKSSAFQDGSVAAAAARTAKSGAWHLRITRENDLPLGKFATKAWI